MSEVVYTADENKKDIREQYNSVIDNLLLIRDAESFTEEEIKLAIRYLSRTTISILRLLKRYTIN